MNITFVFFLILWITSIVLTFITNSLYPLLIPYIVFIANEISNIVFGYDFISASDRTSLFYDLGIWTTKVLNKTALNYSEGYYIDNNYNISGEEAESNKFKKILELLNAKAGDSILNLGCGTCSFENYCKNIGITPVFKNYGTPLFSIRIIDMYSEQIKNKAIIHYKYFLRSLRKVSRIYKIGKSTLSRWLRNEGIIIKRKNKINIIDKISNIIESRLILNPFLTTFELVKIVKDNLNIETSKTSCWRALRFNNFSRKRARNQIVKPNKNIIVDSFKKSYLESSNIISIDETFFYYDIPRYGYSKKGQQLRKQLKDNPKKNKITLYMAISDSGIVGFKLAKVHGNSIDFLDFLKSMKLNNSTILMDNVSFHKTRIVKEYITSIDSSILFTPPYSPEYNPIELVFSKIKTIYRKLCLDDTLIQLERVNKSINSLSSLDCKNFFKYVLNLIKN